MLGGLEARARDDGEAFLTLVASERSRLGVAVRWEGGILTWVVECQVRLLPPRSEVDLDALRSAINALAQMADQGLVLFHHGDGWVTATRNVGRDDLSSLIDRVLPLFPA
jgi:hypothetical protein